MMRSLLALTVSSLAFAACFAPGGGAPVIAPDAPAQMMPPPPAAAPAARADGRWELARPGEPTLVIEVRGDQIVIERGGEDAPREVLARSRAQTFDGSEMKGGVTADGGVAGASCVEVVAVEGDELVVRIGKMVDDRCVLGDETLRLARQIQR